jgi:hypothetical protein
MTELMISRLSATVHGDGGAVPRAERMLARVVRHRLDAALLAAGLPEGEWCVRRVEVGVVIDPDRPDSAIETQWAAALVDALRRALRTGSGDVVHYRRPGDALADLVASVAVGRTERAWAWRRVGLLRPDDPPPSSAAVLAVLGRNPAEVLPVVVRVVREVGVAALHRLFGARGWVELARLVSGELGVGPTSAGRVDRVAAASLAVELMARSVLARAVSQSRLRPDAPTARAWALLVAGEADPALLSRPVAAPVLDEVVCQLARVEDIRRDTTAATGTAAQEHGVAPANRAGPDRPRDSLPPGGSPPRPEGPLRDVQRPEGVHQGMTAWAGLLFLINSAADAAVPEAVLGDPALVARPLPWVLHGIARRLVPAAADDPAVLAFAGLTDPPTSPASDLEIRSLEAHAYRWAATTAARLERADEDPHTVVREVALRRGSITVEPGWVEGSLPFDEVDVDIRRAGLDLDPGWVRWLGTVVRFGYV